MRRLIRITQHRLPFTDQVARLRRQRQWLIDLDRLLDPEQQPPPTSVGVQLAVDKALTERLACAQAQGDEIDQQVVRHIDQVFRSFWWGLFTCYDVPGLPHTNNELERFIRQIKSGQRRVSGRKNVHNWVIRYGPYLACIDYLEHEAQLLARLQQVPYDDFLTERQTLDLALESERKIHRFRHHRASYLAKLEVQWADALSKAHS